MRFIAPLPANSHHGVIEETWCRESPLQPSNRSLRSLGRAKAPPLNQALGIYMPLRALLLLIVFFSIGANAEEVSEIECEKVFSTLDVEQCIAVELDKVEASLNEAYQRLLKQLTQADTPQDNYTEYRKKLLIAQRAWIKFREADCDTQYEMHRSGSIRNSIYLSCKKQRADQRINELNSYAPY